MIVGEKYHFWIALGGLLGGNLLETVVSQSVVECVLGMEKAETNGDQLLSIDEYREMLRSFSKAHYDGSCIPVGTTFDLHFKSMACLCRDFESSDNAEQSFDKELLSSNHCSACDTPDASSVVLPSLYPFQYTERICKGIVNVLSNCEVVPTSAPVVVREEEPTESDNGATPEKEDSDTSSVNTVAVVVPVVVFVMLVAGSSCLSPKKCCGTDGQSDCDKDDSFNDGSTADDGMVATHCDGKAVEAHPDAAKRNAHAVDEVPDEEQQILSPISEVSGELSEIEQAAESSEGSVDQGTTISGPVDIDDGTAIPSGDNTVGGRRPAQPKASDSPSSITKLSRTMFSSSIKRKRTAYRKAAARNKSGLRPIPETQHTDFSMSSI